MDKTDEKILDELKEDARVSFTYIADEIGVSEGTVRNRVRDMQDEGVIRKFTVETREKDSKAIVMIEVSTDTSTRDIVEGFPEDMEVNEVAGDYDLVAVFDRGSPEELNDDIDKIRDLDGVKGTKTYTVLRTTRN